MCDRRRAWWRSGHDASKPDPHLDSHIDGNRLSYANIDRDPTPDNSAYRDVNRDTGRNGLRYSDRDPNPVRNRTVYADLNRDAEHRAVHADVDRDAGHRAVYPDTYVNPGCPE